MISLTILGLACAACSSSAGAESGKGEGGAAGDGDGDNRGGASVSAEDARCGELYSEFEPVGNPSFEDDVVGLLQMQCNASICHGGEPHEAAADLWLGPDSSEDIDDDAIRLVYDTLIDVESRTAESVALVRPGRPGESFFMLKLDDCHNHPEFRCEPQPEPASDDPCGDVMPPIGAGFDEDELTLIRSWIARGAALN